jgi:hypothetical protein
MVRQDRATTREETIRRLIWSGVNVGDRVKGVNCVLPKFSLKVTRESVRETTLDCSDALLDGARVTFDTFIMEPSWSEHGDYMDGGKVVAKRLEGGFAVEDNFFDSVSVPIKRLDHGIDCRYSMFAVFGCTRDKKTESSTFFNTH